LRPPNCTYRRHERVRTRAVGTGHHRVAYIEIVFGWSKKPSDSLGCLVGQGRAIPIREYNFQIRDEPIPGVELPRAVSLFPNLVRSSSCLPSFLRLRRPCPLSPACAGPHGVSPHSRACAAPHGLSVRAYPGVCARAAADLASLSLSSPRSFSFYFPYLIGQALKPLLCLFLCSGVFFVLLKIGPLLCLYLCSCALN
jgi:hypothetical protein